MEGQPAAHTPGTPRPDDAISSTGTGRPRPSRRGRGRRTLIVLILAGAAVVTAAIVLYQRYAVWESTDDAQIDGYIFPVSSRVPGYVSRVVVDNNQYVEAGTVVVQLDQKDYEVAVANAKATLANDQASAAALQTNVPITSVSTSSQLSSGA